MEEEAGQGYRKSFTAAPFLYFIARFKNFAMVLISNEAYDLKC
jgi:hypothetical protein